MEENVNQKDKEKVEEEMIEQAFQQLLNDYLATKHRKRIEIITKAFNFANQAHKGIKRRSLRNILSSKKSEPCQLPLFHIKVF